MKHALITGGAGFIGSHLAEALLARDYRVTAIDDESTGSSENLLPIRDHFNFTYIKHTAADKSVIRKLLGDVDEVYHLAAAVGMQMVSAAPIHTIETNVYPTELLLMEVLRRFKKGQAIKVFLASSSQVYGRNPKTPWAEDDEIIYGASNEPRWSQGISKLLAEQLALAYWRQHELPVVIGRYFNIVGPRQNGRFGGALARFVEAALTGRPLVVHEEGQQVRCPLHVGDAVSATLKLMEAPAAVGQVFNIGGSDPITMLELAELVAAAAPQRPEIELQSYSDCYGEGFECVEARVPDLTRLKATINFRETYELAGTLREVIESTRMRLI